MNSFFRDDSGLTPDEWAAVVDAERQSMEDSSNDEELDKKLEHAKEMEEFYSELARKLQEVL